MRSTSRIALAAALAVALVTTSGCIVRRERIDRVSGVQTIEKSAALGSAKQADVHIAMGAGDLTIDGSDLGSNAMEGTFVFAPAETEPIVESNTTGDKVDVTVRHPNVRELTLDFKNVASTWDLALAEGVPMELDISLGAGNGDLDLTGLDLTDLQLDMGAGDVTVDLSGPHTSNLDAKITAGAGEVTIKLPTDVGVRVSGRNEGVGEWSYNGFRVQGDYLVNDAYGTSDTTIELDVQRGIGRVELQLVP